MILVNDANESKEQRATQYIDDESALIAVDRLRFHVRDTGLLFSALARPRASLFGDDAYPTVELKAAALVSSLAQNHPLFDGNKRLALYLSFAFLRINGRRVTFTNDQAFTFILSVAQSRLTLEEIAAQFAVHTESITTDPG